MARLPNDLVETAMKPAFRILAALVLVWLAPAPGRAADTIDFQRDIRPILSDFCFKCHGHDEKARKGKLRLDLRATALKGGRSGAHAIVPGKPDDSEMIKRLASTDEREVMPPPKTGKKLSPRQAQLLRRWIAAGANYQVHWAYVPPRRPALPRVKDSTWASNPLDLFILARLEREGLRPSPPAGKETLLRRFALDLVGLPPTPEEIDAFVADNSADAYTKQVARLLASPHHGERWGRHWLDAARYADSDGYEKDKPRSVWMYRDWVVKALNQDLPMIASSSPRLPATCCPAPARTSAWRLAFCATR
jgi:hypothetical protein